MYIGHNSTLELQVLTNKLSIYLPIYLSEKS